ncbi:peptide ABC transporter substrate-binding protein [Brevibacillus sp. MER 51]|uniref:peptide ABC transporter substrate-binding protein n=1 Tax=Brevibacillus sp. MER 51 TaxID=2939560 RepID=UPI00203E4045|nr:peptide ABC transporter substrate-binding protein [Brevibacillus sp. MER 51]MCM3142768.1 peptide ABC transporter substrate-binding protein [Brevibacillus sp. MER 51]
MRSSANRWWQKTGKVVFAAGLAFTLAACGQPQEAAKPATQPTTEATPASASTQPEQILRLNNFTEPLSLHPGLISDVWSSNVIFQTFEGLTRIDDKGVPQPAMAQEIKASDDLLTYTFTIRDNAMWSNGDPVTAHDFENAWKWALDSKNGSQYAYQLFYVKNAEAAFAGKAKPEEIGVKATDDKTLVVQLENPTPFFLELTAFYSYFPLNTKVVKEHPDWAKEAGPAYTSNGPFKLTAWEHKNKLTLTKNEHYWDADAVKLTKIEMNMINDANTELSMLEGGDLDWAGAPTGNLPLDAMPTLKEKGLLVITPKAGTYWYEFNTEQKPFHNKKIRQAFSYAISRKDIVENITQGGELVATAVVPPTMFAENEQGLFTDNDMEKAKQLLAEGMKEEGYASIDQLPPITLSYNTEEAQTKIAQAVQDMWQKNLGVHVKLENQEWNVYYENVKNGKYQVARMGWTGDFNDPINFLEIFRRKEGNNHTRWENRQFADLLAASAKEKDAAKRKAILQEAEKILVDEMPVIPFYFKSTVYAQNPKLKGVVISGLGYAQYKWAYFE